MQYIKPACELESALTATRKTSWNEYDLRNRFGLVIWEKLVGFLDTIYGRCYEEFQLSVWLNQEARSPRDLLDLQLLYVYVSMGDWVIYSATFLILYLHKVGFDFFVMMIY